MRPVHLRDLCQVSGEDHRLLKYVVDKLGMSARPHARPLKAPQLHRQPG